MGLDGIWNVSARRSTCCSSTAIWTCCFNTTDYDAPLSISINAKKYTSVGSFQPDSSRTRFTFFLRHGPQCFKHPNPNMIIKNCPFAKSTSKYPPIPPPQRKKTPKSFSFPKQIVSAPPRGPVPKIPNPHKIKSPGSLSPRRCCYRHVITLKPPPRLVFGENKKGFWLPFWLLGVSSLIILSVFLKKNYACMTL